ncbi:hypothetical protein Slin14017_G086030 [Septoria linicola]|nr:hypothetical protein Slin14017_G086030 [Septoria linicola]
MAESGTPKGSDSESTTSKVDQNNKRKRRPSKYAPRQKQDPPDDPLLDNVDDLHMGDLPYECDVFADSHEEDVALVRFGEVKENESKIKVDKMQETHGVYGAPMDSGKEFKLYEVWTAKTGELHCTQVSASKVAYAGDCLDPKIFDTQSAKLRHGAERERNAKKLERQIAVWRHITGQEDLPKKGARTYKAQNKLIKETAADSKVQVGKASGKRKRTAQTSEPDSNPFEEAWVNLKVGQVDDIESVQTRTNILRAFKRFHKMQPTPTLEVILAAYQERIATGSPCSTVTQAWSNFEEESARTGRKVIACKVQEWTTHLQGTGSSGLGNGQIGSAAETPKEPPGDLADWQDSAYVREADQILKRWWRNAGAPRSNLDLPDLDAAVQAFQLHLANRNSGDGSPIGP